MSTAPYALNVSMDLPDERALIAFEMQREAVERLGQALVRVWLEVQEHFSAQFGRMVDTLTQLDPSMLLTFEEREAAFRDYAARLNAGRRAWRKVRWTRLSEGDRRRAAWAELARKRQGRLRANEGAGDCRRIV